ADFHDGTCTYPEGDYDCDNGHRQRWFCNGGRGRPQQFNRSPDGCSGRAVTSL
ncbi:uncharacterized protein METZ01_LOCUS168302, partial [marine metagenome]